MSTCVLVVHTIVCFVLIGLVLLQSGKEGSGVIFGGGSTSLFGAGGASVFLIRITAIAASLFLITSLGYNYLNTSKVANELSVMAAPVSQSNLTESMAPATAIDKRDQSPAAVTGTVPTTPTEH